MDKFFIFFIIFFVVFLCSSFAFSRFQEHINESSILASINTPSRIVVLAVGDILLDRGVEYMAKGDWSFPFKLIDLKADIVFANLENPISDRGARVGSIYSFRAEPESVQALEDFDILSLANNHMLDYTRPALEDTMNILKQNNIEYVGAGFNGDEAFSLKILERKNTKIGFLAYTNMGSMFWKAGDNPGIAWISNASEIIEDIQKAKKKVDVLMVSFHGGHEYSPEPNSFQVHFSKTCIDAGADIILGHHPHVIQSVERYNKGWIAYSLGNFIFDQGFSKETMEGLMLKIMIDNKNIQRVDLEKIQMNEFFQPYVEE